MRITTWNVDKGLRPDQVPLLEEAEADIVALQEVSVSHLPRMRATFERLGLPSIVHTLHDERRSFPFGLLIASRWPLERIDPPGLTIPFPERALCARVAAPGGGVEVMTVHVPPGKMKVDGRPNPEAKIGTFEGLTTYYRNPAQHPQILCGDFNTPKDEGEDGTATFFGSRRQAGVEQAFHHVVTCESLRDAFRTRRGFRVRASSWWNKANRKKSPPRRFDHVFTSPSLHPVEAQYAPGERVWPAGVSDHLPLTVTLDRR